MKNKFDKVVILLANSKDSKVNLAVGSKNTSIKAGALVKKIATILGGGGGGRDDFATAGGKLPEKLDEAFKEALNYIKEEL